MNVADLIKKMSERRPDGVEPINDTDLKAYLETTVSSYPVGREPLADMSKWRSIDSDLPDWKDTGKAELRRQDGTVESGQLDVVDAYTDVDPEIPIFEFVTTDGRKLDIHSFHEWRLVR